MTKKKILTEKLFNKIIDRIEEQTYKLIKAIDDYDDEPITMQLLEGFEEEGNLSKFTGSVADFIKRYSFSEKQYKEIVDKVIIYDEKLSDAIRIFY